MYFNIQLLNISSSKAGKNNATEQMLLKLLFITNQIFKHCTKKTCACGFALPYRIKRDGDDSHQKNTY